MRTLHRDHAGPSGLCSGPARGSSVLGGGRGFYLQGQSSVVPTQQVRGCPPGTPPHFAGPRHLGASRSRHPGVSADRGSWRWRSLRMGAGPRWQLPLGACCSAPGRACVGTWSLTPQGPVCCPAGNWRLGRVASGSHVVSAVSSGIQVTAHCSGLCNDQRLWPRLPWEPTGTLWAECPRQTPGLWVAALGQVLRGPGDILGGGTRSGGALRYPGGYGLAMGQAGLGEDLPGPQLASLTWDRLIPPFRPCWSQAHPADASLTETLSLLQGPAEVQPSINSMNLIQ